MQPRQTRDTSRPLDPRCILHGSSVAYRRDLGRIGLRGEDSLTMITYTGQPTGDCRSSAMRLTPGPVGTRFVRRKHISA